MSRPRYVAAALLDRASGLRPVSRARELGRAATAPAAPAVAPDGLPYPPAHLRVLVTEGRDDPERFYRTGQVAARAITHALERAGVQASQLDRVLDFGCGCGRVARHLTDLPWRLSGSDYNADAVAWCREHLPFADVTVNGLAPPAPHADDAFDLVYVVSVLTHLTDSLGRAWIEDWRRMVRPDGLLLVTTLGNRSRHLLNEAQLERFDRGEPVVTKARLEGMNACVAHHPPDYVTGTLLAGLDVLAALPGREAPEFRQDVYVARVP